MTGNAWDPPPWKAILDAAAVADAARRELRADLRAQVEALPATRWRGSASVYRADVLALIDGEPGR